MKYDFHPERFYSLSPNQHPVHEMLANFSVLSPAYRINADGFRGPEIARNTATIGMIGSSEVLGEGVEEQDTISTQLEHRLDQPLAVANLGVVGYGPQHHRLVIDWAIAELSLEALVVRVTVKQRYSWLRGADEFPAEKAKKERNLKIRQVANSAPFLFVKAIHQYNSPLQSFQRYLKTFKPVDPQADELVASDAWNADRASWEAMLAAAKASNIPILFYVENGAGDRSETLLCRYLQELTQPPESSVVEMGPSYFGLGEVPDARVKAEFKRLYTLGFDPHGNPMQYQRLAQGIKAWLESSRDNRCN